ncbi:MAG: hypothetical protein H7A35_09795 [Planctomycetales bacterium]|nr:hypothetical protein [bacterium]UNM07168.1 MAG: hypothetical protein H7A35_09795 [Planctomycetales bacterium]
MSFPQYLTRGFLLLTALIALAVPAQAEEVSGSDTGDAINRIQRKIEEMAGVLALSKTLDEEQTRALIDDLAELHNEVKALRQANDLMMVALREAIKQRAAEQQAEAQQAPVQQEQPPVQQEVVPQQEPVQQQPVQQETPQQQPVQQETPQQQPVQQETPQQQPVQQETPQQQPVQADPPATDPEAGTTQPQKVYDQWQPYLDFKLESTPQDATYNGWVADSSIDLLWGEYGQMIIKVNNGYTASWTIENSYTGTADPNIDTKAGGEIIVQIRDDEGLREYSLRNGGLGPIFMRWISETPVAGNPA